MTDPLHDDELAIDLPLVRALVDRTLPTYASLPLRPLDASGSSNALFRLGEDLLVRLPRQPGGSASIGKEARWLPEVGPRLPVSTPEVVVVGEPGLGYTERWSVVRWIAGDNPLVTGSGTLDAPTQRRLAHDLAEIVTALRQIDVPDEALHDPGLSWYRGEPLATHDVEFRGDVEACRTVPDLGLDLDAALEVWDEAMSLPGIDRPAQPRWYHGDLLAENLLVRDGRLAAVMDFGGLAVGDPTIDLIAGWEVLDAPARETFRTALDLDDESWLRGRAWALAIAVMTFPYYWRTMPARCADRLAMARAALADSTAP